MTNAATSATAPAISTQHLREVCRVGQGAATCRYILAGSSGVVCAKGSPYAALIDEPARRASFTAQGDNCSGPPSFTAVQA